MTANSGSLPADLLRRQIPSFGRGENPLVETDGKSLIIRNVLFDDGNYYDIRIWRYDHQGRELVIDASTSFLKTTIGRAQELAKEVFSRANFGADLMETKVWFSDVDRNQLVCSLESLSTGKITPLIPQYQNQMIVAQIARVHELFFHQAATAWSSTNENLMVHPKVVPEENIELLLQKARSQALAKKEKKGTAANDLSLPSQLLALLPKPMQEARSSTNSKSDPLSKTNGSAVSSQSPPERRTDIRQLNQALAAPASTQKSAGASELLEGISFADLAAHSMKKNRPPGKLETVYQIFKQIRANPNADSSDAQYMAVKKWVVQMYVKMYKEYLTMEDAFNRDATFVSIESWASYYAAKCIAGYVLDEDHPIAPLQKMLQSQSVEMVDVENVVLPRRPWYRFF